MKEKELFKEAERLLSAFKETPVNKRRAFLLNRIDSLNDCIEQLQKTAHQYYSPQGKELEGLLKIGRLLMELRDKDWREYEKCRHKEV